MDAKHTPSLTDGQIEALLSEALAGFVTDIGYVHYRYGVVTNEGVVEQFAKFEDALIAFPALQKQYGEGSVSITGWEHGVLVSSREYRDLFSTTGTTECPICFTREPHEHSGLEIHRHREGEAELASLRDKRRAEIVSRVANIEKNYSARPRLDAAVESARAAIAKATGMAI